MKVRSSTFVVAPLASGWPGKLKRSWGRKEDFFAGERKEGRWNGMWKDISRCVCLKLSWLVGLIWDRMFCGVYSFFKVCKLCKYWLD